MEATLRNDNKAAPARTKGPAPPRAWSLRDLRDSALLCALAIFWLGLPACSLHAAPVIVLKSSDLTPYGTVATAIENGRGSGVKVIALSDNKQRYDLAVHAVWEAEPDVIVALGARALDAASTEFPSVPVVFGMVADSYIHAKGSGIIAGVGLIPSEKQVLRAIRIVLPGVDRVALLFVPGRSSEAAGEFGKVGKQMGIEVRLVEFSTGPDADNSLQAIGRSCDCLIIYPDPVLLSDKVFGHIVMEAFGLGLPTVAYSSAFARMGALMSVEADYSTVGGDLNKMVDQVLKGTSPRTIGIRPPSRVQMTVNKAVADELRIRFDIAPGEFSPDILPTVNFVTN